MASSTTPDHEVNVGMDFDAFTDILDSDTAVVNIMSKGGHTLTPEQRRRLRTLYKFFNPSELLSHAVTQASFSSPVDLSQGWGDGALKRVKTPLELPNYVAANIAENRRHEAADFFDNTKIEKLIRTDQNMEIRSRDAFQKLVEHVYRAESLAGKSRIRWLFIMLCVYDMVQRKFPDALRLGPKMKEFFQKQFKAHFASATRREHDPVNHEYNMAILMGDLNKWFNSGQKLNMLCEEFGTGSLIILVDLLTPDFVENQMTRKGKAKQISFDFFNYLQLRQGAESTEANRLGDNIRRALTTSFPV